MKKNSKFIEYIYHNCKIKENIPTEVVETLTEADSYSVDINYPPRFNYERCPKKMVPIYYISVHDKIHKYK